MRPSRVRHAIKWVARRVPLVTYLLLAVRRFYRPPDLVLGVRTDALTTPLAKLAGASVLAQPIGVVASDSMLLWSAAPQLQRSPRTADWLWKRLPPGRALPGRALLAAVDGFSYYHWITGTVPKLLAARTSGLAWHDLNHVIVNPRHKGGTNFQTESLALLGIPPEKVVWIKRGMHLRPSELFLVKDPCVDQQTRLEAWALALLRDFFQADATRQRGPERIFISRNRARRRRLHDEDSLSRALATFGFVTVELEDKTLQEQVDLFTDATTVVGLHGAGLTNIIFSRRGARLVELVPDAWRNPCFERLAATCGLSYEAVRARSLPGKREGFAADAAVDWDDVARAIAFDSIK